MTFSPIPCQKTLFNIPDNITYLNCAYMSPMTTSVMEAGFVGMRRKSKPWEVKPLDFFEDAEHLRTLFGKLIDTSADDVALIPSASYGIAIAANNIDIREKDEIIVLDEQFPSNYYQWIEVVKTHGANLKTITRQQSQDWTSAILAAIGEKTKIVALPNVHWTDGSIIHLKEIRAKCRKHSAKLVLDVTQSLGALPFSVREIKPDFLVCSAYKWLLGPYSVAYLYASPEYHEGKPIEHNWQNRADSENFAGLVNYQQNFQPGARRYDVGERANFGLLPTAIASLELILNWKVENIQGTIKQITDSIAEKVQEIGLGVPVPQQRAAHMLGVRFPQNLPEGIAEKLAGEKIYVSIRGNSMRIAPHIYNNEEDEVKLINVLQSHRS